MIELVIGGARSGKSTFAETLAINSQMDVVYIATAEVLDDEMAERIRHHQKQRPGHWQLVEVPTDLAEVISSSSPETLLLIDCLTLWLSNLMLKGLAINERLEAVEVALQQRQQNTILVSNEVGMGIVPENALGRRFRDEAGRMNQRIAQIAGRVTLVSAGLPLLLKGPIHG
ncbi:bifunctional adenosylcobinamide kinase/adenosylcobinamide-phosphate guanylyltransferase [Corallincola platygyrae]|uniref:Bifunctional adenosylcobalamin biosynthesis protein n=1 Tax=Corallincola platygyrae TaxID=1193278 RepID=A0ABW4XG77_9GAMM